MIFGTLAGIDISSGLGVGIVVAAFVGGAVLFVIVRAIIDKARQATLATELSAIRIAADAEAQKICAQAEAQAKSEYLKRREQFDRRERMQETAERALAEQEKALANKDRHLNDLIGQQKSQLMKVANLSPDDARKIVLEQVEKDAEQDAAKLVSQKLEEANETAEVQAREIILQSIQRYASEQTCDHTVSAVDIPSDDMKGRIIGREGRNIRAFEKATGVDVIVDDTPGVVICSAFDPVRREIGRRTLERLIQDGRIHPTRIEEITSTVRQELNKEILQAGKNALMEANIHSLHPKLVELLGRLQFRTSYGQNILQHSMEVAYLAQVIADQLGLNGQVARRAGLLHDIGKAADHEVEGGHPQIGADLLARYSEKPEVINAAAAHHGDIEAETVYTPIVLAADAISASRPGARRDSLERYVQRLEKLEGIATAFEGVKTAYAIQADRSRDGIPRRSASNANPRSTMRGLREVNKNDLHHEEHEVF